MKIVQNVTAMAAVGVALTFAAQARANTIDFFLTQGECTGSPTCTAPAPIAASNTDAVEVVVTTTATGATVEFEGLNGTGKVDTPAWINVNTSQGSASGTWAVSSNGITFTNEGSTTGSGSEDHFGTMTTGTGAVMDPFVLITLTGTWTNAANVLALDTPTSGIYSEPGFEADTAAQFAGYYSATPLPAALPLFVSGLGGLGLLGWRRKRKNTAAVAAA